MALLEYWQKTGSQKIGPADDQEYAERRKKQQLAHTMMNHQPHIVQKPFSFPWPSHSGQLVSQNHSLLRLVLLRMEEVVVELIFPKVTEKERIGFGVWTLDLQT